MMKFMLVIIASFFLFQPGYSTAGEAFSGLGGAKGKAYKVDYAKHSFEFLTKTEYDPKTHEGRSRHTIYWDKDTRFIRTVTKSDFSCLNGWCKATFSGMDEKHIEAIEQEQSFFARNITVFLDQKEASEALSKNKNSRKRVFTSLICEDKNNSGAAIVSIGEKKVKIKANRWMKVTCISDVSVNQLVSGLTDVQIFGKEKDGRFVASRVHLTSLPDPRKMDNPELPRVLVVGDSISMNYHEHAKKFLTGKANYYRVEGNGGSSDRGVATMDLWLGNYWEKGLQWDVIQLNHGLHDLKQKYDETTKTWGQHQVPIDQYKKNLEIEIKILKKTGAKLIWATTTPVPRDSSARGKGQAAVYNKAAAEVMARYPEIQINDLYTLVQTDDTFAEWRKGDNGVHFKEAGSRVLGKQVTEIVLDVLDQAEKPQAVVSGEFYVAPNGSDANPGTKQKPFVSLAHARDAVRKFKTANPKEDVTVLLRGGVYPLQETVVFTLADSGGPDQRITYAAYPGEKPIICSDVSITGWKKLETYPNQMPQAARGKVWVADVSCLREMKQQQERSPSVATQMDQCQLFYTLYNGDRRLQRARGDGFSLLERPSEFVADSRSFAFPKGALRDWPDLVSAELLVIPHYYWISNILPIEQVSEASGTGRTAVPCTYLLNPPRKMSYRTTAWVENVLALLDEPGEWVLNSKNDKLYLWPLNGEPDKQITAPVLTELIRVEGKTDYEVATDTPVKNIVFRGLTFSHGDRFPWHGKTGWGLQHDWERFDSPSAMLRFRGAENCGVEDCRFVNAGSSGLRFDLHAQNNKVVGNIFEHLGGVGILLAGYGPGTKNVSLKNEVSNNLVHNIGELYWGSPAIFIWQSGENRIANNHLFNLPYAGICVTGRIRWDPAGKSECSKTVRWEEVGGIKMARSYQDRASSWYQREKYLHARNNVVNRNDIHDVTQVTGDGNCIYVSGAGTGNVVQENYCHDCFGPRLHSVIRCDDDQNGTTVKRNIIHRIYNGRGEGLTSKGKNDFIENIIADLRNSTVDRHRGYIVFPNASVAGSLIKRNILYSDKTNTFTFGQTMNPGPTPVTQLLATEADRNLYYSTKEADWGARHLSVVQAEGIEKHSVSADPMFTDIEKGDFSFKPGSPALKLGIEQPVLLDEVGLQAPYRERWNRR